MSRARRGAGHDPSSTTMWSFTSFPAVGTGDRRVSPAASSQPQEVAAPPTRRRVRGRASSRSLEPSDRRPARLPASARRRSPATGGGQCVMNAVISTTADVCPTFPTPTTRSTRLWLISGKADPPPAHLSGSSPGIHQRPVLQAVNDLRPASRALSREEGPLAQRRAFTITTGRARSITAAAGHTLGRRLDGQARANGAKPDGPGRATSSTLAFSRRGGSGSRSHEPSR
jgi:hypothetical protein